MHCKELRTGNIILRNGKPFQVDVWTFVQIHEYTRRCDDFMAECEGIKLTPNILKKCGFEEEDLREFGKFYSISLMQYKTKLTYNAGYIWIGNDCTPCKYLHELQNLHYALTGEDLKINLFDL